MLNKFCYFLFLFFILCLPKHDIQASQKTNFTVVVSTCDKYHELWKIHFHFLFKNWPSLVKNNIPIILTNNKIPFNHKNVISANLGDDFNWSDNIIRTLKKVETKYVVLLLEDYILDAKVNVNRLQEIIDYMDQTKAAYTELIEEKIAIEAEDEIKYPENIDNLIIKSKNTKYRASLQATVWNGKILSKLLKNGESAWSFEHKASERSNNLDNNFYMVIKENVISYKNAVHNKKYNQDVIAYINENGLNFSPSQEFLSVKKSFYQKFAEKIKLYVNELKEMF